MYISFTIQGRSGGSERGARSLKGAALRRCFEAWALCRFSFHPLHPRLTAPATQGQSKGAACKAVLHTKGTPVFGAKFSRRNLLFAVGPKR